LTHNNIFKYLVTVARSTLHRYSKQIYAKFKQKMNMYEIHGSPPKKKQQEMLMDKPKKSGKTTTYLPVRKLFHVFVRANRIPTGRTKGKQFRLISVFKRLKSKKQNAHSNPLFSLDYHFNRTLSIFRQNNKVATSVVRVCGSTVVRWFKKDFSDTVISPHPTDYCDTCSVLFSQWVGKRQQISLAAVSFSKNAAI
jgi:hypothetical protein